MFSRSDHSFESGICFLRAPFLNSVGWLDLEIGADVKERVVDVGEGNGGAPRCADATETEDFHDGDQSESD